MGATITSGKKYKNNKSQTRPSIVIFGKKYFEVVFRDSICLLASEYKICICGH